MSDQVELCLRAAEATGLLHLGKVVLERGPKWAGRGYKVIIYASLLLFFYNTIEVTYIRMEFIEAVLVMNIKLDNRAASQTDCCGLQRLL